MKKLKTWNWGSFFFIILFFALGACSNKTLVTWQEVLGLTLFVGIPTGILFAYLGRLEN